MSKKLKYSVALLVAISIGNTAIAKNHGSIKFLGTPSFEKLDFNNDRKLSKKEIETQRDQMDDLTQSASDFLESLKNSTPWRCTENEVNTGQRLKKFEAQNKCVQLLVCLFYLYIEGTVRVLSSLV